MTTTAEHIAAIRKALEAGPTPGEWKPVSDPHFDSGLVYTSVQPVTADAETMKPMAMMNGEYHVCRMSHTAAAWRFSYHRRNAAYIASCNPVAMTAVLAEVDRLKAENERMREALEPFADIAGEAWADSDGWTEAACQKDRIVDWFGPSAFRNARAALKGDTNGN